MKRSEVDLADVAGFVPTADTRKRALVLDTADAVVKEWRLNGSSFELGDLLHDLARAVES